MRKFFCAVAMIFACYGFWGSFFPDLTLVKGTYAVIGDENGQAFWNPYDAEIFYAELLEDKYHVTYRSKLWELIQNKYGRENNERTTK